MRQYWEKRYEAVLIKDKKRYEAVLGKDKKRSSYHPVLKLNPAEEEDLFF